MKKIIIVLLFALSIMFFYPQNTIKTNNASAAQDYQLEICRIPVTHFFTHALIAYPEIAFREGNEMRISYDRDCLTVIEFNKILDSLYKNNYMLIDINEIYEVKNDRAVKRSFLFPKGKKPLIFSFDDINYYISKMNLGMNDKIIISNNKPATYTANADKQISYDNEVITVLENFIAKYPDFSYKNAKGILCVTGFNGVLGYRTQYGSIDRQIEIEKAVKVIKFLKNRGWKFACHSYGHYHMKKINNSKFISDIAKWKKEVEPLVGKTDLYVYPYGEWEIEIDNKISIKHQYLEDNGFNFFFGVCNKDFFGQMPINQNIKEKSLFMDRHPIDGYSLRTFKNAYMDYFDCEEIYDHARYQ